MNKLALYFRLIRLDKPIGTVLLLWPTLCALWLAQQGVPSWRLLLIFLLGTFLMRSAGCAINDYADQDIDKFVKRTADRPITSGRISGKEALAVAGVLTVAAFCLILPLNALTKQLSVAAVIIAATYPYFKRFFAIPQAYLGIAFGFGIPMGFAAITDSVPAVAWLLLVGNVFWAVAYDTEYAMVDRDDDLKIGIKHLGHHLRALRRRHHHAVLCRVPAAVARLRLVPGPALLVCGGPAGGGRLRRLSLHA